MSIGSDMRADLVALFIPEGYGRTLKLRRVNAGTYDVETGDAPQTTTDKDGVGKIGSYADRLVDGANIRRGDRLCTFIPNDATVVPEEEDRIVDGAEVYQVVNVKKREINDFIAYTLQVRR